MEEKKQTKSTKIFMRIEPRKKAILKKISQELNVTQTQLIDKQIDSLISLYQ